MEASLEPRITLDTHRRTIAASVEVVSRITTDQLDRPTPCDQWRVQELLAHMTVQHYGFAAAAAGAGPESTVWQLASVPHQGPVKLYEHAAATVLDAFQAPSVLDRDFWLPEISTARPFVGHQAITFHFIDYVAHTWDVSRALGMPLDLDEDILDAAVRIAFIVPDGPGRRPPGGQFRPSVPVPDAASRLDRAMAWLGRPPDWSPSLETHGGLDGAASPPL
jgi:uncharacterized protein (TIGR03086 family)